MARPSLTCTTPVGTFTRQTARPYTHVVVVFESASLKAVEARRTAAQERAEIALEEEAYAMIAAGVTPPAGHALLKVRSVNGYHRFTRWDDVARQTDDYGRTFRNLNEAEARAKRETYYPAGRDARAKTYDAAAEVAESQGAEGGVWYAASWHQGERNVAKGVADATRYNRVIAEVRVYPVDA